MSGIYDDEILGAREQALSAEKLRQAGVSAPQGQMVSGWYVPPSPTQYLAAALRGYSNSSNAKDSAAKVEKLRGEKSAKIAEILQKFPKATTSYPDAKLPTEPAPQEGFNLIPGPVGPTQASLGGPVQREPDSTDYTKWAMDMAPVSPEMAALGAKLAEYDVSRKDKITAREETAAARAEERAARAAEAEAMRQWRATEAQTARDQNFGNQRALVQATAALRPAPQEPLVAVIKDGKPTMLPRSQAVGLAPASGNSSQAKPMPGTALKMQQEELDAIGTAASINADLGVVGSQIEGRDLKLGPAENLMSTAKNAMGMSDKSSRNFASFKATLEKLRNDSLRLNKGVQTDGDAQRAWNELMANISDKGVVQQRLVEIQKINERAASLRKMNIDTIRRNYGQDPLDVSGYENQMPALNHPAPQPQTNISGPPPGAVRRKN